MDEVYNANFSFNKKSHVDALLQKVQVEECDSESVIYNNVIQKNDIVTQRDTYKKHADNQPILLGRDSATHGKCVFK